MSENTRVVFERAKARDIGWTNTFRWHEDERTPCCSTDGQRGSLICQCGSIVTGKSSNVLRNVAKEHLLTQKHKQGEIIPSFVREEHTVIEDMSRRHDMGAHMRVI